MEIIGPLNLLYILATLPPTINITALPLWNKLVAALYVIHYINRAIINPFFAAPSMSPIHVFIMVSAMAFNWFNSTCLAGWLVGYQTAVTGGYRVDGRQALRSAQPENGVQMYAPFVGVGVFVVGMLGNVYAERTLYSLRREEADRRAREREEKEKETAGKGRSVTSSSPSPSTSISPEDEKRKKNKYHKVYVIPPARGVFRSILYPHYVFEWLEWVGFALAGTAVFPSRNPVIPTTYATPPITLAPWLRPAAALADRFQVPLPLPAVLFVVNAIANMLPHARWGRKWYVEKFGDAGVQGRGAVVPWLKWL
ncbi:hypothetical protein Plec18167_000202 [Paecilomyces lecythidis]|uniref:3-oxo-5-alpha-steroid 4-dehydrogenase C-terminal domain-containing protein n=1 Tax=Paecilomyces lecythidis TaxID=3004212 RepID=A0ABR3YEN6_9EURO